MRLVGIDTYSIELLETFSSTNRSQLNKRLIMLMHKYDPHLLLNDKLIYTYTGRHHSNFLGGFIQHRPNRCIFMVGWNDSRDGSRRTQSYCYGIGTSLTEKEAKSRAERFKANLTFTE
jgi:hypothetical protein